MRLVREMPEIDQVSIINLLRHHASVVEGDWLNNMALQVNGLDRKSKANCLREWPQETATNAESYTQLFSLLIDVIEGGVDLNDGLCLLVYRYNSKLLRAITREAETPSVHLTSK